MEHNQPQKIEINILKQQDISQVIKHFSFTIQQRFEQIQKNFNYFSCLNSINYDRSQLQKEILHKYSEYKTSDQHQIKLIQKFVERLLQIFDYFKQKTDQPEILQQMSQKINQKFRQILKNQTSYQFFVNNRPKTHTINAKPLGSRSSNNDFLSIIGPGYQKNIDDIDSVLISDKKLRTQMQQKRVIEVGKLFKYIFSVLKRGYLVKLKMQRPQKKLKTVNKENCQKVDENTKTISVQGTCAILRNCSQKGNKENNQNQCGRMISFCRQKLGLNPLGLLNQNKKQFQITQKIKNRSISTNQYSFVSSQNASMVKQSTSKIRQLDRKINFLYGILDIQKYGILKVAKQSQICKKDQLKRNQFIMCECKRFRGDFQKWKMKEKGKSNGKNQQKTLQNEFTININDYDQGQLYVEDQEIEALQEVNVHQNNYTGIKEGQSCHDQDRISKTPLHILPLQINFKTQEDDYYHSELTSVQNGRDLHHNTINIYSSRPQSKLAKNVLTDKSSNLIYSNLNHSSTSKTKSITQYEKKNLRLNLPMMLTNNNNYPNPMTKSVQNNGVVQKTNNLSQKSQCYLQNYHMDSNDDGVFVPLLPKKDLNNENVPQYRKKFSIKKNNLMPNFHPLNRCRIFRQKKTMRNSMMIPLIESKENNVNLTLMNGHVKNAIF